ncbi:MAG: FimB/Mfa2 family fimbrial subunit [Muribaculaceae bacterium]|nr:FimB/Mfa2 family fimbrial subunit [Muribaculaceae bacterium]
MNHRWRKIIFNLFTASLLCVGGSSCDNLVYDDEGDCQVHYYLQFVYDMNLKWANAFASEVTSVNLYVYDKDGKFLEEFTASGDELKNPDYMMELTMEPGDYQLVAWCGIGNSDGKGESFTVSQPTADVSTLEDMMCSLNTKSDDDYPVYSDTELKFLFQGNISVSLPDSQDGKTYYYTMPLTKDTNHVRIILQELSGGDIEASDFDITIDGEDADMAYDNSLVGSTQVAYLPWNQESDEMELTDSSGNIQYNKGLVADLSTARLMAEQANQTRLTVRNSESAEDIIASVPIIQYALLAKSYYEQAYGHQMTDQEFLDREDEYQLTFFLYKGQWISSYIYINSWRVVIHDYDVES